MSIQINKEIVHRVKSLTDPELVVRYLGFHIVRKNSKELRGACKVHGGDNPTAFKFNLENKTWCCYTKHCEDEGDRDIIGLVQKITGQGFVEAVKFLANLSGVDLENQDQLSEEYLRLKKEQEVKRFIEEGGGKKNKKKFFPEEIAQEFIPHRTDYFVKRGFPNELLDFFQVGGARDGRGIPRETIPIRDEFGNLITISGRRTDCEDEPRYLLLGDIPKSSTLYNLDVAKNYVSLPRTLILVEGFVDVWNLALHGVWNVVACMGTSLKPEQVHLLSKYAEDILVMLDPDEAGRKASEKVVEILKIHTGVKVVDTDIDPKNLTYADVKQLFGGYVNYV